MKAKSLNKGTSLVALGLISPDAVVDDPCKLTSFAGLLSAPIFDSSRLTVIEAAACALDRMKERLSISDSDISLKISASYRINGEIITQDVECGALTRPNQ